MSGAGGRVMVAPRVRDIWDWDYGSQRTVGIQFSCPECDLWFRSLRMETAKDWTGRMVPDLAAHPGPLGFILRCDGCGFRVEMHGNRLPTVGMMHRIEGGE